MRQFLCVLSMLLFLCSEAQTRNENDYVFVSKPYLQIGDAPLPSKLHICWQTSDEETQWLVEVQAPGTNTWTREANISYKILSVPNLQKRRIYTCVLSDLIPGSVFMYRIQRNKKIVFQSVAHALKQADQPYRFIAMGDIGAGTADAKLIAQQASFAKADLFVIPGDIVYDRGLVSEYDKNFWPVYNADSVSKNGAPLMRSIPFVAAPGNHDTETRDFQLYPDALAYFMYWDQPLNGPFGQGNKAAYPTLTMPDSVRNRFLEAAGKRFPVMTNFSFNYGNAHWLMLDADNYVDWTNMQMLDWVRKDLAASAGSTWRFVVFHHPGFSSSVEHFEQQQMRLLAPLFDSAKVDLVFNGHVHNYQRSYPMHFVPASKGVQLTGGKDNQTPRGKVVNGRWILDKSFDGKQITKANGVIYIVTGAGGQELYNKEQNNDTDSWQKFTDRFISVVHSFSVVDVNGKKLTLEQTDINGNVIDQFILTKN